MASDKYPDEVEIVNDDFSTRDQEIATTQLADNWKIEMQEMAESGDYSRSHYQSCRDDYLGPVGEDRAFGVLREEYGSVRAWMDKQESPDLGPSGVESTVKALQEAFAEGYQQGFEDGYDRALEDTS